MTVTVADAYRVTRRDLAAAGVDAPALDARLLVGRAVGDGPGAVTGYPERVLTPDQHRCLADFVARRAAREPLARILGRREFWSLSLAVSTDTLVPRPDSETLIQAAVDRFPERHAPRSVLDLGTGSGCLLLALLSEFPGARGLGVDISPSALDVARRNARDLGLDGRARFIAGDWGGALAGRFDLVVANPPYIADGDIPGLAPEVTRFEPRRALSGGPDGLRAYRAIAPQLAGLMGREGTVFLEIGLGQVPAVTGILQDNGLKVIDIKDDLAAIPRCIVARTKVS
jgi:release factor glutamine methyltransferase